MNIKEFYKDVLSQNKEKLINYFHSDAVIRWHCTNELFTAQEFIRANCEYPGSWSGEIQRVEKSGDTVIAVFKVCSDDGKTSFHVVSFLKLSEGLIAEMDEYWGDDGEPPKWRQSMKIGKLIAE